MDVNAKRAESRHPLEEHEIPHAEHLAALVRACRHQAGLTQGRLADGTGIHLMTVWTIENATRRTRESTLRRMAQAHVVACPELGPVNVLGDRLVRTAGPALAPESQWAERVEKRRLKREQVAARGRDKDSAMELARQKRAEEARARAHWRWWRENSRRG